MPCKSCVSLLLLALAASAPAAAEDQRTSISVTVEVPLAQDSCLDHTVKELGMSAKKVEGERRWAIGPQYLHPSIVTGGAFGVQLEKGAQASTVRVTAAWPGGPKEAALQSELEQRLVAMASKMAQHCDLPQAPVTCTVTLPSGKLAACAGAR